MITSCSEKNIRGKNAKINTNADIQKSFQNWVAIDQIEFHERNSFFMPLPNAPNFFEEKVIQKHWICSQEGKSANIVKVEYCIAVRGKVVLVY